MKNMKLNKYSHFLPLYIEFKGLTFTYYIISSRNLTQKWCTNGVKTEQYNETIFLK